jgi:hypothetical protein
MAVKHDSLILFAKWVHSDLTVQGLANVNDAASFRDRKMHILSSSSAPPL